MVYTPQKHPKQALILITVIASAGILGGLYISEYFLGIALMFWMQYTAVLSYLQFKHKHEKIKDGINVYLLNPILRFFIFELIAFWGLAMLIWWETKLVGILALAAWWIFSLNFYFYYKKRTSK